MSSTPIPTDLVLLQSPVSTFVQKVKIALLEKNLEFTSKVPEDFVSNATSGPLTAANPRREVPALIDGDLAIFDSTIILEYLEDKWPESSLLPKNPAARAQTRMVEEICDVEYDAANWGIGEGLWFQRFEGPQAEQLHRQGKHHVETLQKWLSERLGSNPWFGGDQFGWADICVVPVVNRSLTFGLQLDSDSPLAEWFERAKQRPSVATVFKEVEGALPGMPRIAEAIRTGKAKREFRSSRLEWLVKAGGVDVVAEGIRQGNVRFTWPDNI